MAKQFVPQRKQGQRFPSRYVKRFILTYLAVRGHATDGEFRYDLRKELGVVEGRNIRHHLQELKGEGYLEIQPDEGASQRWRLRCDSQIFAGLWKELYSSEFCFEFVRSSYCSNWIVGKFADLVDGIISTRADRYGISKEELWKGTGRVRDGSVEALRELEPTIRRILQASPTAQKLLFNMHYEDLILDSLIGKVYLHTVGKEPAIDQYLTLLLSCCVVVDYEKWPHDRELKRLFRLSCLMLNTLVCGAFDGWHCWFDKKPGLTIMTKQEIEPILLRLANDGSIQEVETVIDVREPQFGYL